MTTPTIRDLRETAGQRCARLLLKLHRLIADRQGDSDQADLLRDEMDPLWDEMDERERDRIRGLSADLHALREGGPPQLRMDREAVRAWRAQALAGYQQAQSGNVDEWLVFLRRPFPRELPAHVPPFLQARCWEQLGVPEVALVFLQAAEQSLFSDILATDEKGGGPSSPVCDPS
jgi:hypothetical protein